MTKDEALRLALEALESHLVWFSRDTMIGKSMRDKTDQAITAIKAALEANDEPVPVAIVEVFGKDWRLDYMALPVGKHKLYAQQYTYTTPPQRKPLTNEEIVAIVREASRGSAIRRDGSTSLRIARAIEAAHGIKDNT